MKIQTIVCRLDSADDFDIRVNYALAEGWVLKTRRVLLPKSQPASDNSAYIHIMLYAELERAL